MTVDFEMPLHQQMYFLFFLFIGFSLFKRRNIILGSQKCANISGIPIILYITLRFFSIFISTNMIHRLPSQYTIICQVSFENNLCVSICRNKFIRSFDSTRILIKVV